MNKEEFYRNKIAEFAGDIKSLDRLRKFYTVAKTLFEMEKEVEGVHDGTLQSKAD